MENQIRDDDAKKKTKTTNAERCRKYQEKKKITDPSFLDNERKRVAAFRERKKSIGMSEEEMSIQREKERLRKQRNRKRKLSTPVKDKDNNIDLPYIRPQSLGKAINKAAKSLPYSPRKKMAVVSGLAKRVGISLVSKLNAKVGDERGREFGLSRETLEAVQDFYYRPDIVYTAPGMRDEITVWHDGMKSKERKYYLTLFLREAFAIFSETHPNCKIKFSKFCALRPKNVLLLKDTPSDQCRCKIHENFFMKLNSLKINYDSVAFWESVLCSSELNSKCWLSECQACSGGKNLSKLLGVGLEDVISWREWAYEKESRKLKLVVYEDSAKNLLKFLQENFYEILAHINIKRIQSSQFLADQNNPNLRILQMDFAMNYSCEYQNEVQSALWSRASVTLFTAATFYNSQCKTFLICSDSKEKSKDTIAVFIDHLYENYLIPDKSCKASEEVIWTDGPSSEFKNRYMMKLLQCLSSKFQRKFTWRYFATSHGKGIVDGVGGRAKSLVRVKSFSKDENAIIVQSSEDFAKAASLLMEKTIVGHISQVEIEKKISKLISWEDVEVVHGIQKIHQAECQVNGQIKLFENSFSNKVTSILNDILLPQSAEASKQSAQTLTIGDWCVVLYDGERYPGEVVDKRGEDIEVSVMHRSGKYFKWPSEKDVIFYEPHSVIKKISAPELVNAGLRILSHFPDLD